MSLFVGTSHGGVSSFDRLPTPTRYRYYPPPPTHRPSKASGGDDDDDDVLVVENGGRSIVSSIRLAVV
jgi:hypothetical protein